MRLLHGVFYAAECQHVIGSARLLGNAALLKLTRDNTAAVLNNVLFLWLVRVMDLYVVIIDLAEPQSECFDVPR